MGDFSVNFLNLLSISFPVFLSAFLSFFSPLCFYYSLFLWWGPFDLILRCLGLDTPVT